MSLSDWTSSVLRRSRDGSRFSARVAFVNSVDAGLSFEQSFPYDGTDAGLRSVLTTRLTDPIAGAAVGAVDLSSDAGLSAWAADAERATIGTNRCASRVTCANSGDAALDFAQTFVYAGGSGATAALTALVITRLNALSLGVSTGAFELVTGAPVCDLVTLSSTSGTFSVGAPDVSITATASASGTPLVSPTITAVSSDPSKVTVSVSGSVVTVHAVADGTATITVTCQGISATYTATVEAADVPDVLVCDSVTLSASSGTITVGSDVTITVVAKDGATVIPSPTITAVSSDASKMTVSVSGNAVTFHGVAEGGATGTVTCGGVSATYTATVSVASEFATPDLAQHNFNNGLYGPYVHPQFDDDVTVIDDPTGSGRGKVLNLHHHSAGGESNKSIAFRPASVVGLGETIFFAGDFFIPAGYPIDAGPGEPHEGYQRKLLYYQCPVQGTVDNSSIHPEMESVLSAFGLELFSYNETAMQQPPAVEPRNIKSALITTLPQGEWFRLERQVTLNTHFNTTDGIERVWINGVLKYENTAFSWSDPNWTQDEDQQYWYLFVVGAQTNYPGGAIDELRYLDNISFSTQRIGPTYNPPSITQASTVTDTLVDADGTDATLRFSDSGHQLVPQDCGFDPSAVGIVGHELAQTQAPSIHLYYDWTPPSHNYYMQATFNINGRVRRDRAGFNLFMDPASDTGLRIWWDQFLGTAYAGTEAYWGGLTVERHNAGTVTPVGSVINTPWIDGSTHTVRAWEISGTVYVSIDGGAAVTLTDDAPITDNGFAGVSFHSSDPLSSAGQALSAITTGIVT